jgi:hypothetical protein
MTVEPIRRLGLAATLRLPQPWIVSTLQNDSGKQEWMQGNISITQDDARLLMLARIQRSIPRIPQS